MTLIIFIQTCFLILVQIIHSNQRMRANTEQRQPCKYGPACKFLLNNNCYFYHPPQNTPMRGRLDYVNNQSTQQYPKERRSISRSQRPHQNNSHPNNYSNHPNNTYSNNYPNNQQNNHSYQANNRQVNSNQGGKMQEDPSKLLCKNFHIGMQCKYGQKCERLHQFLFKEPQDMRRLEHRREIPQHISCKLTKIEHEGRQLFALRQGNEVYLFEYSFQTAQLNSLCNPIALPNITSKCEFYDQKDKCLYYSAENLDTKFTDMGFFNIETQETVWIPNCHSSKLTGLIHWDVNTLLSSSIGGEIKVWSKGQEGFTYNKQMTQQLVNQYNPNRISLQILCLDIYTLSGIKIISAGTSDSRLLFWSGQTFDYLELPLGTRFAKIFKIKLTNLQGIFTAAVLAWNTERTNSAVLLINLQTNSITIVREVCSVGKNIHLLEWMDSYIFIGSLRGEVSIYNLKVSDQKIGAILHQNMVADILCSTLEMKTTGVKVKLVYALENRTPEIEGSFSIYLLQ